MSSSKEKIIRLSKSLLLVIWIACYMLAKLDQIQIEAIPLLKNYVALFYDWENIPKRYPKSQHPYSHAVVTSIGALAVPFFGIISFFALKKYHDIDKLFKIKNTSIKGRAILFFFGLALVLIAVFSVVLNNGSDVTIFPFGTSIGTLAVSGLIVLIIFPMLSFVLGCFAIYDSCTRTRDYKKTSRKNFG